MAAIFKAVNAKIRSNKVLDYVCSTRMPFPRKDCEEKSWLTPRIDFWGPVSNFGIPVAAVMDTQKDPEMYVPCQVESVCHILISCFTLSNSISGSMTASLVVYSATFMRYSLAITPKNYLLFGCHAVNFSAQAVQGYRYLQYHQYVLNHACILDLANTNRYLRWGGHEAAKKEASGAGA